MDKRLLRYFTVFVLLPALAVVVSCKKDQTFPPPALGEDYLPLQKGSWISYKADSIVWNDFYTPVKIDTFSYYIKMVVDSSFTDNEGRTSFVWRKYYRTDTTSWEPVRNYTITKTAERVETYEENIRYIKMAFPVKNTTWWDLNAFNTFKATESYYDEYDIPLTINSKHYDSCATVIHKNLETLVSKEYHKEVFAKHIGLVYKEITSLSKEVTSDWKQGFSYKWVLTETGNE